MGQSIAEKILATKSGATRLSPRRNRRRLSGCRDEATPATWRSVAAMKRIGATKLLRPRPPRHRSGSHLAREDREVRQGPTDLAQFRARKPASRNFTTFDAGIAHPGVEGARSHQAGATSSSVPILIAPSTARWARWGSGNRLHRSDLGVGDREAVDEGAPTTIKFVLNGKFNTRV